MDDSCLHAKEGILMVCDVQKDGVIKNAPATLYDSNLIAVSAVRYITFLFVIYILVCHFEKFIDSSHFETVQKNVILRICDESVKKIRIKKNEYRQNTVPFLYRVGYIQAENRLIF